MYSKNFLTCFLVLVLFIRITYPKSYNFHKPSFYLTNRNNNTDPQDTKRNIDEQNKRGTTGIKNLKSWIEMVDKKL